MHLSIWSHQSSSNISGFRHSCIGPDHISICISLKFCPPWNWNLNALTYDLCLIDVLEINAFTWHISFSTFGLNRICLSHFSSKVMSWNLQSLLPNSHLSIHFSKHFVINGHLLLLFFTIQLLPEACFLLGGWSNSLKGLLLQSMVLMVYYQPTTLLILHHCLVPSWSFNNAFQGYPRSSIWFFLWL